VSITFARNISAADAVLRPVVAVFARIAPGLSQLGVAGTDGSKEPPRRRQGLDPSSVTDANAQIANQYSYDS
jgi:hypothetical protein